jgi:hypothetical protein
MPTAFFSDGDRTRLGHLVDQRNVATLYAEKPSGIHATAPRDPPMKHLWLRHRSFALALTVAGMVARTAAAAVPDAIAAPGETMVATLHAEGAQIYDCKADAGGKLVWQFREPIATLLRDGATVGRHYAGPNWEASDGSAVTGKAVANAAGTTTGDIPWLKLDVVAHRGSGTLSGVTTVQRINTHGGVVTGPCDTAGAYFSAPYSADYVFLRK